MTWTVSSLYPSMVSVELVNGYMLMRCMPMCGSFLKIKY